MTSLREEITSEREKEGEGGGETERDRRESERKSDNPLQPDWFPRENLTA